MSKTKTFPKEIIVTLEQPDTRDEFLQVNKTADDAAEVGVSKCAAVYSLRELVTVKAKAVVTVTRR